MITQMVLTFSVIVFLALVAFGYQFGFHVGLLYTLGALAASPLLSFALVMTIAYLADWSDRRARARRIAKAAARRA
jgi:uncharacterized membrane protein YdjX (TVP38/TMEM64 family)